LEGSDSSAEEDEMGMDAVQLTEKKIACFFCVAGGNAGPWATGCRRICQEKRDELSSVKDSQPSLLEPFKTNR